MSSQCPFALRCGPCQRRPCRRHGAVESDRDSLPQVNVEFDPSEVGRGLTFVGKDDGLAAGVAHRGSSLAALDVEGSGKRSGGVEGLSIIVVEDDAGFRS